MGLEPGLVGGGVAWEVGEIRRGPGTLEMVAVEKRWQVGSPWGNRGAGSQREGV